MALIDALKGSFASGELSPRMLARQDVDRYKNGAILLENFKVLPQGGLTRCEGTRFVAEARDSTHLCVLKAFEPSTTDAYILEMGVGYLRFYKNGGQLPTEVLTPYQESELRLVRTAQSNDIMILVHGSHPPQRLSRLSDTQWDFRELRFNPPPTFEAGHQFGLTLTLGATTGTGVSVTASGPIWLQGDIDRVLSSGIGRGILRTMSSATVATMDILEPFADTSLEPFTWTLEGAPVVDIKPSKAVPPGAQVTVTVQGSVETGGELVTNGSFTPDLTGWVDYSHELLATGQHDGPANSPTLFDGDVNFLALGVKSSQLIQNLSDGSSGILANVTEHNIVVAEPGLTGGLERDFDIGDGYEIYGTGAAYASGSSALLTGGSAGLAWISQGIGTTAGGAYHLTFRVSDASLSLQIGTAAQTGDVLAEASYGIGTHSVTFSALSATSYVQFRNNQPSTARLTAVSSHAVLAQAFRDDDIGKYIRAHDGLIKITSRQSASQVTGEIIKGLSSDQVAPGGAWSLESPAWSDALGWPGEVILYEGRLCFFGTARFPQDVWQSAVDDLFNFAVGTNPSDAMHLSLVDSGGNITLNRLRWAMPAENLLLGTTHGEYRLIGSGDDPLTPTSLPRNRIQSTFGSDTVKPLKVGSAILFVQRQGSKIREMSYDVTTQTTFVARDITVTSDHLLKTHRVIELAYQQEPQSIIYAVRSDGQLLGLTYDQSEQLVAWWRRTTQGVFESVATIPDPVYNSHQVWVVVQRTVGSVTKRFIERLDADARMVLPHPVVMRNDLTETTETVSGWDGLTVDCGLTYSGAPTATLAGLAHLEGAEVQIVGDGAVFPPATVAQGKVTLSQPVSTAFVGLGYTPKGRTMPVELPIRGATSQGLRKRWARLTARVEQTACLVLQGERLPFRQQHMPQNQGVAPYSGDRPAPTAPGWDRRGMMSFEVDQPLPCTLIGIFGTLDTETQG